MGSAEKSGGSALDGEDEMAATGVLGSASLNSSGSASIRRKTIQAGSDADCGAAGCSTTQSASSVRSSPNGSAGPSAGSTTQSLRASALSTSLTTLPAA